MKTETRKNQIGAWNRMQEVKGEIACMFKRELESLQGKKVLTVNNTKTSKFEDIYSIASKFARERKCRIWIDIYSHSVYLNIDTCFNVEGNMGGHTEYLKDSFLLFDREGQILKEIKCNPELKKVTVTLIEKTLKKINDIEEKYLNDMKQAKSQIPSQFYN